MDPKPKTNQKIRIGFAGLGGIAKRVHLPVLAGLPGVEIVAGAEKDSYNRERVGRLFNISQLFEDYNEMYEKADLDAIYVCLPVTLHYDAVTKALEKGLHVFCEKPVGRTSKETEAMVKTAAKQNKILFPGFNFRFVDNFQKAREIALSGKLGKIIQIQAVFLNPGPYISWDPKSDWHFEKDSGGALYDAGSHLVNLLVYLFPDALKTVHSFAAQNYHGYSVLTNISSNFLANSGAVGTIDIGWKSAVEYCQVTLHGTGGTLIINRYFLEFQTASTDPFDRMFSYLNYAKTDFKALLERVGKIKKKKDIREEYINESAYFMALVRENKPDLEMTHSAITTHQILETMAESIKTGQTLNIQSFDR